MSDSSRFSAFVLSLFRAYFAVLVCGGLSILLAVGATLWQQHENQLNFDARYNALTNEFADLVTQRFHLYQYGLRATRGAIIAGGGANTSRETFINYFKTRDQFDEFPGARGSGYIERVPQGRVEQFVNDAKADGFPSFAVRELSPNSGERFIIKYIYPLAGNEGATGLDIASEANRRHAAETAAYEDDVRLTAPITLVQASGQTNHGFLILMPIYDLDTKLETPEQRIAANYGWSYSPLVVSEVLRNLSPRREEIAFSITDIEDSIEFYKTPEFESGTADKIQDVTIFGRKWEINFHVLPAFYERNKSIEPLTLGAAVGVGGLALTFALFGWARNREHALQIRREEEEFAYKIVDAAPQALLVVNEAGTIVRANSYSERVFGWKPDVLKGKSVEELIPPNYRDAHVDHRKGYDYRVRDMGERSELEALHSNGNIFPIRARLSPLTINDRKLVVAGITDTTSQREAIEVLSASQQRWQELANSLPQLVWTCDASGACNFLSEQWVEYTGISTEKMLGMGWLDQVHPDDIEHLMTAWAKSVESKTSFTAEYRIRRKDGGYRLFFTRGEPVLDQDGNVERWIGSNTDIEDRHQAELRVRTLLEELEERVAQRTGELNTALRDLQNVLDAVPSMISYWDRNLNNRFANRACEKWFGVTCDWLKGRHLKELLGNEGYAESLSYIEATLRGEPQLFERDLVDTDGITHATQVQYLPDESNGEVYGFYAFIFDVSIIKASEQAQKVAREAAETATRAKSAFLTSMSHELRTPMNSILGFSDLLIGEHFGPLNEKQLEHAGLIRQSGEHLLNLMDGVLELSKIEAGRVSVSIEPVNVTAAIKSVVASLEVLSDKYKVEVRTGNLGNGRYYVNADATRLAQVLINLGSNAIKYNRPGGWVEFSILVRSDGKTRIYVTDNGLGISAEQQEGAFQPFNRMGAEQGKIEGSGIGLALVRNYVELMGGSVGFESTEGEGSKFWVDFQTADEKELNKARDIVMNAGAATTERGRPLKVLYVEDNELNRSLFRYYMEALENIELLEAEDGLTGLPLARTEEPDLIFLDINLPGMNGYDILQEIRSDPRIKATKVIALTANAMSGDAERGIEAGFDQYLAKPVRLEQLTNLIAEERRKR